MLSDIEIAQAHEMKPIADIAARVGLGEDEILQYGHYKAKVPLDVVKARPHRAARLVLVTGCSPTAAGRGQVDHFGRARRRAQPSRAQSGAVHPRGVAGSRLRDQGRGGRRGLFAGRADGGHQPPLHRRLPRDHVGARAAVRDARQPSLPPQLDRAGPPADHAGGGPWT